MSPAPTAPELLRSIGLEVDGPTRWGSKPTSRNPGIFLVETPTPSDSVSLDIDEIRRWLERVPDLRMDGDRPTQSTLAERMRDFWLPGHSVLYAGRTAKSLSARVASLYATELGYARPHPGGHWLKALREVSRLRLWWSGSWTVRLPWPCEDPCVGNREGAGRLCTNVWSSLVRS